MLEILLRILEFPLHRTGERLEALAMRFDLSKTSRGLGLTLVDAVDLDDRRALREISSDNDLWTNSMSSAIAFLSRIF